jgi:hypothetical protein
VLLAHHDGGGSILGRAAKDVVPSGLSILTGRTAACKAPAFALLRAGGLANFSASRSLTLTGKTSRPGLAFHGPLAVSQRECQKGNNNGSNYSEGSVEVVSATGYIDRLCTGTSVTEYKKKNRARSLLPNGYRQVARSENKREIPGAVPGSPAPFALPVTAQLAGGYGGENIRIRPRRKEGAHTQLQSVLRTIHNCSKFFCATIA